MYADLTPRHTLTVRIGCAFTYDSMQAVPLILNLKPRRDPSQALQEEKLVLGANLPAEEFDDVHGNIVYRLILQAGRNEIRHDAIVTVPAFADNHAFGPGRLACRAAARTAALHAAQPLLRFRQTPRLCVGKIRRDAGRSRASGGSVQLGSPQH